MFTVKNRSRTTSEARVIREAAAEHQVIRWGLIHAGDNYRRVVELIQMGRSVVFRRFTSGSPEHGVGSPPRRRQEQQ